MKSDSSKPHALTPGEVIEVVKLYRHSLTPIAYAARFARAALIKDQVVRAAVAEFLSERVFMGFNHCAALAEMDPHYSSASIGSIVRSMYEATVNFLYILSTPSNERLASFMHAAAKEENKRNDKVGQWRDSQRPDLASAAKGDYQTLTCIEEHRAALSQAFNLEAGFTFAWPTLEQRAKEVGPTWAFYYDAYYRALSGWQHGDTSRLLITEVFANADITTDDRAFYETFLMMGWAYQVATHFALGIGQLTNNETLTQMTKANRQLLNAMISVGYNDLINARRKIPPKDPPS